jgi:hypothetical protein
MGASADRTGASEFGDFSKVLNLHTGISVAGEHAPHLLGKLFMISLDYSSARAQTGVALLGKRSIDHRVTDRNVRRRDCDLSDRLPQLPLYL